VTTNEPTETPTADAASAEIPQPTYAPPGMALGIMMLLWGVTTLWIASAAGACLMGWSLWMWIGEIRRQPAGEANQ